MVLYSGILFIFSVCVTMLGRIAIFILTGFSHLLKYLLIKKTMYLISNWCKTVKSKCKPVQLTLAVILEGWSVCISRIKIWNEPNQHPKVN